MLIFVHPQTINPIGFERVKDPLLMPVLEYSFDISMFLGMLMMHGLLGKYKVRFIFSSLAGVIPFLKDRFDRVYAMLRKRDLVKDLGASPSDLLKDVYVDTSGSSLKNIELAIDLFGEDKILWGSDYPVNVNVKENIEMFRALNADLRSKIVYQNLSDLLK
jgi:predicted TIM-barrel fold metal-dependent hydrolase